MNPSLATIESVSGRHGNARPVDNEGIGEEYLSVDGVGSAHPIFEANVWVPLEFVGLLGELGSAQRALVKHLAGIENEFHLVESLQESLRPEGAVE